ncbi:MAG: GreA/GreB family elongation factor [Flavobacteriales bacterium]|jgi:transcription elongation GreA/GreB family factor|nr:GreA/GreB family elongation factor [Flavobacteriales bacterium]
MNKEEILQHLRALLLEKVSAAQQAITSTRASFENETKSSAGDKHEVGRAMIQQELDQQEAQLDKLQAHLQELARLPMDREFDFAGWGSLVATDQEGYFIAIGFGYVDLAGERCAVVSPASPIGKALMGKRIGDVVTLNGRSFIVKGIS